MPCVPSRPPIPTLFPYTTLFRSFPYNLRVTELTTELSQLIEESRKKGGKGLTRCVDLALRTSPPATRGILDRKSTRLNSSHLGISYAVFCLKKKKKNKQTDTTKL